MKLKYYLRGLGIGIILSVIILMIGSALTKEEMSDEEIIARAQELGMVMPEEDVDDGESDNQLVGVGVNPEDNQPQDNSESDEPENLNEQQPEPVMVTVEIVRGEYSDAISQKLLNAGLITDVQAFNSYLVASGLDQMIEVGQHQIPQGATIEEIAGILCEKIEN